MDGVLDGATLMCVCKLACSLLFLPSLRTSDSPVSFCCCCLLIFTDFLVTVFLSCLRISEFWAPEPASHLRGDVIALRSLLFLGHTYGAVLLLTTPLIAVETLTRLVCPHPPGLTSQTGDGGGKRRCGAEVSVEEGKDGDNPDKDKWSPHAVSYLGCLSVWVVVALSVGWRWTLQDDYAAACLHTTDSLLGCLPNLLCPLPSAVGPGRCMAFLCLLLLLLTTSISLQRHLAAARRPEREGNYNRGSPGGHRAPAQPVSGGTWESAQRVDPEKTESSCAVGGTYSWNIVQMLARLPGDPGPLSLGCVPAEEGGREHGRTKRGRHLTFPAEGHAGPGRSSQLGWRQWGFPSLWVNVMIGSVGVLSTFGLPLNLSVNIFVIRYIETLVELCARSFVASAANTSDTPPPHNGTFV